MIRLRGQSTSSNVRLMVRLRAALRCSRRRSPPVSLPACSGMSTVAVQPVSDGGVSPAVRTEAFTMAMDWLAGGLAGCIAKTATAPVERVKLLIQTQAANPRIMSGEVAAYEGTVSTMRRVSAEQGVNALWRGNVSNCLRFFPTQVSRCRFSAHERLAPPKSFEC
jgi:hypothetical protein